MSLYPEVGNEPARYRDTSRFLEKWQATRRVMSVLSIDVCKKDGHETRRCGPGGEPRWPGPLRLQCQRFQRRGNGFACPGPAKDPVDVPTTCTALMDYVLIVPPRLDVIITGAPSALIDDLYVAKPGLDETGARMRARLICEVACAFSEPQLLPRRRGETDRK